MHTFIVCTIEIHISFAYFCGENAHPKNVFILTKATKVSMAYERSSEATFFGRYDRIALFHWLSSRCILWTLNWNVRGTFGDCTIQLWWSQSDVIAAERNYYEFVSELLQFSSSIALQIHATMVSSGCISNADSLLPDSQKIDKNHLNFPIRQQFNSIMLLNFHAPREDGNRAPKIQLSRNSFCTKWVRVFPMTAAASATPIVATALHDRTNFLNFVNNSLPSRNPCCIKWEFTTTCSQVSALFEIYEIV